MNPSMKHEIAHAMSDAVMDYSRRIDESIQHVMDGYSEETFRAYRKEAGRVAGYLFTEILVPIWNEHEDLAPPWYRLANQGISSEPTRPEKRPLQMPEKESPKQLDEATYTRLLGLLNEIRTYLHAATEATEKSEDPSPERFARRIKSVIERVESARKYLDSVAPANLRQ